MCGTVSSIGVIIATVQLWLPLCSITCVVAIADIIIVLHVRGVQSTCVDAYLHTARHVECTVFYFMLSAQVKLQPICHVLKVAISISISFVT